MAWVVTAWKPEVVAAAEREGIELPQPVRRFSRSDPGSSSEQHPDRPGRATLRDSPLGELFRSTG